jgi:hypothetical protein
MGIAGYVSICVQALMCVGFHCLSHEKKGSEQKSSEAESFKHMTIII